MAQASEVLECEVSINPIKSATFTDGAGTTLTVSGGTITYHELPGFDLAPREYEVPREYTVKFSDVSWTPERRPVKQARTVRSVGARCGRGP